MLTNGNEHRWLLQYSTHAAFCMGLIEFVHATLPAGLSGRSKVDSQRLVEAAACEAVAVGLTKARTIARFVALKLWLSDDGFRVLLAAIYQAPEQGETTVEWWLDAAVLSSMPRAEENEEEDERTIAQSPWDEAVGW